MTVQEEPSGAAGKLGLLAAIALVMGNMIGSGIFLLPASLAPYGWNAVIGWIATIAGSLVLALVLARLTRDLPETEDTSGFVKQAFGPLPGFMIAWSYLVSLWVGVAAIAVAGISYLTSLVPQIGSVAGGPALATLALIWAVTAVNLRGLRSAGNFQLLTLVIKLIPLLLVVILAVGALGAHHAHILPLGAVAITGAGINASASLTLWALVGFEAASIAAQRVRDPQVNVPRATLWGTGLTGLLYLLVCSAIALMLPPDVVATSNAPFAAYVAHFWGPQPASLVAVFAVVSCVGAVNGWILLHGELPRAMATRGLLPRWFAQVSAAQVPRRTLIAGSLVASCCVALNATRSVQGLFEFLLLLSTCAALWLYLACALAAWKFNIVRGFALLGAIYAVWTLWGAGEEALGWSVVLLLAGFPIWWTMKRANSASAPQETRP